MENQLAVYFLTFSLHNHNILLELSPGIVSKQKASWKLAELLSVAFKIFSLQLDLGPGSVYHRVPCLGGLCGFVGSVL